MFTCTICKGDVNLHLLAVPCGSCPELCCLPCASANVVNQVKSWQSTHARQKAGFRNGHALQIQVGQAVRYIPSEGAITAATVVHVDKLIQPPQYEIRIAGAITTRWTEGSRLLVSTDQAGHKPAAQQKGGRFEKDQPVFYLERDGAMVPATVLEEDKQVQPPQYLVHLAASGRTKWTEGNRLVPCEGSSQQPSGARFEKGQAVLYLTREGGMVPATVVVVDLQVQPPQYEVKLAGSDNLRFTEGNRLRPAGSQQAGAPGPTSVSCPGCSRCLRPSELQSYAPDVFKAWEQACTEAYLEANDVIRCPHEGCGVLIQRSVDPTTVKAAEAELKRASEAAAAAASGSADAAGRQQQRQLQLASAAHHAACHRFRCGACARSFCAACRAVPYHELHTCEEHVAPDCLYCGDKVLQPPEASASTGSPARSGGAAGAAAAGGGGVGWSPQKMKWMLNCMGADCGWCVEKVELTAALQRFGNRVCTSKECRARLSKACTRQLPCRHWCCGVRGEAACPPCVACQAAAAAAATAAGPSASGRQQKQKQQQQAAQQGQRQQPLQQQEEEHTAHQPRCPLCIEPLLPGPCCRLSCGGGHLVHLACAEQQLQSGYPGADITFGHLFCPLCRSEEGRSGSVQVSTGHVHLDHPALTPLLKPWLELREAVLGVAKQRFRVEGLHRERELQPGGAYDGRPMDWALQRMTFYRCDKCKSPYFGGLRSCNAGGARGARAHGGAAAGDPDSRLLCGRCSALTCGTACKEHGTECIEYKCRYCCRVASWLCWGTTHMCTECHDTPALRTQRQKAGCTPSTCCLKGVPHAPPGEECCLGCGLCRAGVQAGR